MRMSADTKRRFILLLAAALLLVLGGWYQQRQQPVTLRIGLFAGSNWDVPDSDSYAVVDAAVEKFEREHPGVTVSYVSGIKKEDYPEWLAGRLLSGDEPDIFVIPGKDFNLYASIGALQPIGGTGSRDPSFSWEVYYPAALDYGRYDGEIYALPAASVPTLMFVNKTLLAREGIPIPGNDWTWQEFYEICRRVTRDTDGDGRLDQFGVYDYGWRLAAVTNGVQLFRADGRASFFADPRMEEAVRFLRELHKLEQGREVTARDFDMGRVAFRPFTFAEYRTYKPYPWRIKKYSSFEWDCIPLPAGPSGSSSSSLQTMLMGMSARSHHKGLAWQLLKEICYDPEIQKLTLERSQGLPVRRDVVESGSLQELPDTASPGGGLDLGVVSAVMDHAVMEPKFARYEDMMMRADSELRSVIDGSIPFDNALNRIQKEINGWLQQ